MPEPATILFCHCAHARVIPRTVQEKVLSALRGSGRAFEQTPDLCGLSARQRRAGYEPRQEPDLKALVRRGRLTIVACHERAVRWLFAAAGADLPAEGAQILNMRTQPAGKIVRALLGRQAARRKPAPGKGRLTRRGESGWVPWFPVIDYDRCRNCRQCLGFCLFGVYALDPEGKVRVENPTHCKTNCPACARICPEAAIIFPKYDAAPINGDRVQPGDLKRQKMKVDLSKVLKEDAYRVLRARGRSGAVLPAGELDASKAVRERDKCSRASSPAEAVVPLEDLLSSPTLRAIPPARTDPGRRRRGRSRPSDSGAKDDDARG
jgi:NAD-dependent dihydropyrimidine dehydrogenase PreA subunit